MLTTREHADEAALSMMRMMQNVADGQLLQASNQAWHAAEHAVNAAAAARGRNPVKYSEKRRFLDELADEPGNEPVRVLMRDPWQLHGNADQGFMTAGEVAIAVRATEQLVIRLLEIAGESAAADG